MVDGLRRAIGFLTVYPLRETESWTPETAGHSMVYYPFVGTLLGISLWILYVMLSALFAPPIVQVLLIAGLVLMTGGLHIDRLANAIDGLYRAMVEDILRIQDVHQSIAIAAVMLVFLLKYACLGQLSGDSMLTALILMTTLSRYAMVQLACFSPYALASGGQGEPFLRGVRHEPFRLTLLVTLVLVWGFGGVRGLLIGCLVGLATLGYQAYCVRRLGGITGDVLSATNEVNESLVLVLVTMVY